MRGPETLIRLLGPSKLFRSTLSGCSRQGLPSAACSTIGKALGGGLLVKEALTAGQTICSLSSPSTSDCSSVAVAPLVPKGLGALASTPGPSSARATWLCSQELAAGAGGNARAAAWTCGASTHVSRLSSQSQGMSGHMQAQGAAVLVVVDCLYHLGAHTCRGWPPLINPGSPQDVPRVASDVAQGLGCTSAMQERQRMAMQKSYYKFTSGLWLRRDRRLSLMLRLHCCCRTWQIRIERVGAVGSAVSSPALPPPSVF
jgi:hypothetical protein